MANNILHERHADEGLKLHGIVMGASASGIAFALHETADRTLTGSMWVILGAVSAWAISFAAGVMNRRKVMQALKSNLLLNEANARGDQEASGIADEYLTKHRNKAFLFQEAQLWALLAGAVLYVGGHVWHLAEIRPAEASRIESRAAQVASALNAKSEISPSKPSAH